MDPNFVLGSKQGYLLDRQGSISELHEGNNSLLFNTNAPLMDPYIARQQPSAIDGLAQGLQGLSLRGSSPAVYSNLEFQQTPMNSVSDFSLFSTRSPFHDSGVSRAPWLDYEYRRDLYRNYQAEQHPRLFDGYFDTRLDLLRQSYFYANSEPDLRPRSAIPENLTDLRPRSAIPENLTDRYGSFRFQNNLERSNDGQIANIVFTLTQDRKRLIELVKDQYGVNYVKKLIEAVKGDPELLSRITSAIGIRGAFDLMIDLNGSKLVRYCLEHLKPEDNLFLSRTAVQFCFELATNLKGNASLKHCIDKSREDYKQMIVNEVIENSVSLATNQYGNFIVQFVLEFHDPHFTRRICLHVKDHLEDLSRNKCGTYVVEKCLSSSQGELLLRELVRLDPDMLEDLAMHPSGNYVLQTALKVHKNSPLQGELANAIKRLPNALSCDKYARNVLSLIRVSRRER